jgi:hypothetical protein
LTLQDEHVCSPIDVPLKETNMDTKFNTLGPVANPLSSWKTNNRELPDDPALPGLVAIRQHGLAGAIPALGLKDSPVELINRGYTAGSRITLEARAGQRRFAVKAYADDPSNEAVLYQSLANAGLKGASECQAPALLLWERELRVLVISWLEGPSAEQLILSGQGARAGELAAKWLLRMDDLARAQRTPHTAAPVPPSKPRGAAALAAVDPDLGAAARTVAAQLSRTLPQAEPSHLVHGTLYTRHIFDLGGVPGVIDWQRFGLGPRELDAGIFLATAWRARFRPQQPAAAVTRAEECFLASMNGRLDERALAWHRSAMLLRLASKLAHRKKEGDWSARSHALLNEAARFAVAGCAAPIHR